LLVKIFHASALAAFPKSHVETTNGFAPECSLIELGAEEITGKVNREFFKKSLRIISNRLCYNLIQLSLISPHKS
jgi:hypothetical protein